MRALYCARAGRTNTCSTSKASALNPFEFLAFWERAKEIPVVVVGFRGQRQGEWAPVAGDL